MTRYAVESWGVGAVLVCQSGGEVQRFWLPSKREAHMARAQAEAGDLPLAQGGVANDNLAGEP